MKFQSFDTCVKQMLSGQLLLVLCCVFYLIWWCAAFRPGKHGTTLASGASLVVAALCGTLGVIFTIKGIQLVPKQQDFISGGQILAAGIAVYVALLLVTRFCLHRQVTTELLLIVGWTALELSLLSAVYGGGMLALAPTVIWCVVVVLAAVISLVCYLLYYGLSDRAGYIDGMIPLILVGVVAAGLSLHLYLR